MNRYIKKIKDTFFVTATMKDLFLSGNFKNSHAFDAINNYSILEGKLNRIGMEIDNQDHLDLAIIDLLTNLSNTLENQYNLQEIKAQKHHEVSFQDCINLLDAAFDTTHHKHPNHEGIQMIRTPFDILKRWYERLDPEQQDFCERLERRLESYTCPFSKVRNNILTPKTRATLAIIEIRTKFPNAIILRH